MGNTESNTDPPPGAAFPSSPNYEVRIDDDTPIYINHEQKNVDSQNPNTAAAAEKGQEVVATPDTPPQQRDNNDPTPHMTDASAATAAGRGSEAIDESEAFGANQQQHMRFGKSALKHGISDLPESCRGTSDQGRFEDEEKKVRMEAAHNVAWLTAVNGYSALMVFIVHLISMESMLAILFSVGFTVFTYYRTDDNPSFDGSTLDWVLLSFAVITPLSASISMSFGRREAALKHIASIRATMIHLYAAHASWDWKKIGKEDSTGRKASTTMTSWLDHADAALVEILGICHVLGRFLTLPNATRARHRITTQGRKEAHQTLALSSKLYGCLLVRLGRLTDLCEILKSEGLPPNEATRIRQWERMVLENCDGLRMIKVYRTPQALRSFARLFTVLLPPFYAPFYAEIARSLGSLGMGIAFSVLTSLALTALFETISQMEDPFLRYTSLDGVDVDSELSSSFVVQCLTMRSHFFRDAKPFDERRVTTSTCERLPLRQFDMFSVRKTQKL
ncbi:protein Hydra magnipapillata [Seminavis robusta]|uniref:Protein Hydra magnipapillata n=1 Tax=Seminavis robusta TaxID=568900 RepID=A0A9N8E048_9STRA|nr:protein Hydra magnipapillata [Seminavis robusta]|eukprot:Sro517_g158650.1 protein Hydra magnipapillata (506) ;mRNA; r:17174-18793